MRPLSPDEHFLLATPAGFEWSHGDMRLQVALDSLVARGCFRVEPDPDEPGIDIVTLTELGQLALRVSVQVPT